MLVLAAPADPHALDACDHVLWAAEPEIDEMVESEGDNITRMRAQDRFPQGNGSVEFALGPGDQGGDVASFAGGGVFSKRLRGARLLDTEGLVPKLIAR